jgi:hypothetical protein
MMWQIFRKDCSQLWPLAATIACAHMTNTALRLILGPFNQPRGLVTFAELFSAATLLGMCALIVVAVQEDVVPGASQDWLVRPIRRRDLVVAKLLFVVVVVQGPALLADIAHGIVAGLEVGDSVSAAFLRSTVMLLVLDVPVLGLAAMTSTLVQVMVSMIGIWLAVMVGVFAGIIARGGTPPPFASSGIQWMTPAYWSVLACSAAAVIIPLQYFRRATTQSRGIVLAAVLLAPVLSVSTWTSAFAVQQRLSPHSLLAEPIRLTFAADGGTITSIPGITSSRTLLVPLRVSGLPADSVLLSDRAEVRLAGPDGGTLYRGKTTPTLGYGNDFVVRTTDGGDVSTRQQIVLPEPVYQRLRNQSVRMEIDYSLTVLDLAATATIAAGDGDQRMAAFGRCRSQIDEDGDEIELGCLRSGPAPTCVSATLESVTPSARNPTQWSCDPDYSPYHVHLYPDATSRFTMTVKLADVRPTNEPSADRSQLDGAFVRVKSYQPAAHFTRRLVVHQIRVLP